MFSWLRTIDLYTYICMTQFKRAGAASRLLLFFFLICFYLFFFFAVSLFLPLRPLNVHNGFIISPREMYHVREVKAVAWIYYNRRGVFMFGHAAVDSTFASIRPRTRLDTLRSLLPET